MPDAAVSVEPFKFGNIDEASRVAKQLSALLASLYGGGYESFSELNEEIQNNMLWLASDLATELDGLVTKIALGEK